MPFLAWFIAGYMPWMLFSDIINSSLGCLFIHSAFLLIMFGIAFCYGIFTGLYLLQVIYYLTALLLLAIPLAFLCSAVNVFFKDFAQGIGIVLNMWMWITPIVWDFSIVEERFAIFFKLNSVFYVVEGFRDSVLYGRSILEHVWNGVYFWAVVIFLWVKCMKVYHDLVPYMADVL